MDFVLVVLLIGCLFSIKKYTYDKNSTTNLWNESQFDIFTLKSILSEGKQIIWIINKIQFFSLKI